MEVNLERATNSYYNNLAHAHASIWFKDDERKYNELEKMVYNLLKYRNHEKNISLIANLIRKCYEKYGLFDDKKINQNINYIFNNYIFSNFKKIYKFLPEKNSMKQAEYHSLWWKNFYLKKKLRVIRFFKIFWNIMLYHKAKFNRILPSISCTILLIQAGNKHNKKDFEATVSKLIKYWKKIDEITETSVTF